MKKTIIIFAAVVIIASMCAFLVACTKHKKDKENVSGVYYENAESYSHGDFTYAAADIEAVDICWVKGDVNLVQSDGETLSVSETGETLSDEQRLHYFLDGQTLKIQFWQSGLSGKINSDDKELTVEIPHGIDLTVINVSGDICGNALNGKDVKLSTTSGDVDFNAVTCESLNLISVSGDVEIDDVRSPAVSVDETSGDVNLQLLECESCKVTAVSSEIEITLLGSLGATVSYSTVSGAYKAQGGSKTFGDGACEIKVVTVSGDLEIQR